MFVTPDNFKFLYKYGKKEKGLRKTLNKKLPINKKFIQRYVLYYTGLDLHAPVLIEWELEEYYKGKLTNREIKELGDYLSLLAFVFCKKHNLVYFNIEKI